MRLEIREMDSMLADAPAQLTGQRQYCCFCEACSEVVAWWCGSWNDVRDELWWFRSTPCKPRGIGGGGCLSVEGQLDLILSSFCLSTGRDPARANIPMEKDSV